MVVRAAATQPFCMAHMCTKSPTHFILKAFSIAKIASANNTLGFQLSPVLPYKELRTSEADDRPTRPHRFWSGRAAISAVPRPNKRPASPTNPSS